MNEMLKPEMMRDMMPRENPKKDADEAVPESGVRLSAEQRKPIDPRAEDAAKTEAQNKVQEVFSAEAGLVGTARTAEETPTAKRERIDRENKAELEEKIVRARAGLQQAAEYLRNNHGIDEPAAALSERAKGGGWGKIKGFFNRLGNSEQRAKDHALDTYEKMEKSMVEMEEIVKKLASR